MKPYSRVYAQINLDAIIHNLEQMRQRMPQATQIMAVLKTDGYGHGAAPIAHILEPLPYIWGYAVATAEEAFSLRKHNLHKPILLLGVAFEEQLEELVRAHVRMTVYQKEFAEKLQAVAQKLNENAYVHIKVDTAMCRLGIRPQQADALDIVAGIAACPNLSCEGIFTHFSKADEADPAHTSCQLAEFLQFTEQISQKGISFPLRHCANSAGIIGNYGNEFELVRAGIALYGMYPSKEVDKSKVLLEPALSLHSCIAYLKEVPEGVSVGYGGTYTTDKPTRIATVPVGYGDGYPRMLSNKCSILIRGRRAPVIGRICMDQFMADVTGIEGVKEGDDVVLVGSSGSETITAEELGAISGRFNYEFVCDLNRRIPRVYVQGGKITGTKDWFDE